MVNYKSKEEQDLINLLLKSGVHLGHSKEHWNPKIAPYIYGTRFNHHILDLKKTVINLSKSIKIIEEVAKQGKSIMFVGTKPDLAKLMVPMIPKTEQFSYVSSRWIGGTLTNWSNIKKFIEDFKQKQEKDPLSIKKSQQRRFYKHFKGLENCSKKPDLIVLFHLDNNQTLPLKEAQKELIPTIAISDTNTNPENVTVSIPGNDDNLKALFLYTQLLIGSAIKGTKN